MAMIAQLLARKILDSRGIPTIEEVDVTLDTGGFGRAAAPSGGSIGTREALEMRDGNFAHNLGQGVRQAVANVKMLVAPAITGVQMTRAVLDGANTMLAVSIAVTRALTGGGR